MRVARRGWWRQDGTPRANVRRRTPKPSQRHRGRDTSASRSRRAAVRRIILSLLALGTMALLAWEVQTHLDRWLVIREITIDGNAQTSKQELAERLSLKPGATLLSVSTSFLASRLEANPWIKQAVVERKPPHRLAVTVTERRGAAVVRSGQQQWLVDDEGAVLAPVSEGALPSFPVLTGLEGQRLVRREVEAMRVVRLGVRLAALVSAELGAVPTLQIEDPDHVVAAVEGLRVEFGPTAQEEQWGRFMQLRQAKRTAGSPSVTRAPSDIDLRYPGKVIVRERG